MTYEEEERQKQKHVQRSIIANAEERIKILIREGEEDEAIEEIEALCAAIKKWIDHA